MGKIIGLLLLVLISQTIIAQTIYDEFHIRSGRLTADETWEGKNILASDVLIPENITLTLAPHTWLVFNNNDAQNLGHYPDQVELITHGKLVQSPTESATILNITDPQVQDIIKTYDSSNSITIRPEAIDTEPVHRKINRYKHHYVVTWAVIYSILLILS